MIEVKTENDHIQAALNGNVVELAADTMVILETVYNSLSEENKKKAMLYRKMFEILYREVFQ